MDERVQRVMGEFAAVDGAVARFSAARGLACPEGCGSCCNSPDVETTTSELLPMAEALAAAGRTQEVLDALAGAPTRCVLYRPDPRDPARGRCSAYATRPLVCRVFGFATRWTRIGRRELIACGVMRGADPGRQRSVESDDDMLALAPVAADHGRALAAVAPSGEARAQPINDALAAALMRVALSARLCALSEDGGGAAGPVPLLGLTAPPSGTFPSLLEPPRTTGPAVA